MKAYVNAALDTSGFLVSKVPFVFDSATLIIELSQGAYYEP